MKFCLLILIITLRAGAESPSACEVAIKEVDAWGDQSLSLDKRELPEAKWARALEMLTLVHPPTPAEIKSIKESLSKDFAHAYLPWVHTATADCPTLRLKVTRPLINSAASHPELKRRLVPKLKARWQSTPYPTLLGLSIDALALEYAVQHHLWQNSAAVEPAITQLRADLKAEVNRWRADYGALDKLFQFKDDSKESIARFAELNDLDKMRKGVLNEIAVTEKYRAKLQGLATKLDP